MKLLKSSLKILKLPILKIFLVFGSVISRRLLYCIIKLVSGSFDGVRNFAIPVFTFLTSFLSFYHRRKSSNKEIETVFVEA